MPSKTNKPATWPDVLGLCMRFWNREPVTLSCVLAILVAMATADVAAPLALGGFVGAISDQAPFPRLAWLLVLVGAALLAQVALKMVLDRVWNGFAGRSMQRLQLQSFGRVQRFSADWHANTFAGATVHKLSRARWALDMIGVVIWTRFTPPILSLVAIGFALWLRAPLAGVTFLAAAMLLIAVSMAISTIWVRPANMEAAEADSRMTGAVADCIGNNATVKAFGSEAREDERLRVIADAWRGVATRSWNRGTDANAIQQFMWAIIQLGVLMALIATGDAVSAADIAFVVAAQVQLGGHLRTIGGDIRVLQRAFGEFADAIEFLRLPFQVKDVAQPHPFKATSGQIVFENVRFSYGVGEALYKDFSLRIAPGERIGLVGPSGSGKSTFVKLIQRLYDVQGGAILIDGQNIALVQQSELRGAIATVPQDPSLFHRSLAENIAYGRPGATLEQIVAAAKRARAHQFISKLPNGYETLVGERGVKLSGGERQRVALARAFLADAPILILDEATSSLDTITERHIQAAIEELMANRTTIVIAHRLSTVRAMDRILVFDEGRVVEQGSHAELINRPQGRYRSLHTLETELELIA